MPGDPTIQGAVTAADLIRLRTTLETKCGYQPGELELDHVLNSFGKMLDRLSSKERELLLTLTDDFLRCPIAQYQPLLTRALCDIDPADLQGIQQVVFLPLAEVGQGGKVRSPANLLYLARYGVVPFIEGFPRSFAYEKLAFLKSHRRVGDRVLIVFLDDFIGSGTTAVSTLERYKLDFPTSTDPVVVVALVAQQAGLEAISAAGFRCKVPVIRRRGISDSVVLPDPRAALAVMDGIEARLAVSPRYRRGYKASESLVRMIRTPNNTFPVFWIRNAQDGTDWPAPFFREQ